MNPLLNKLLGALTPGRLEYLAIDREFLIIEMSWGVQRFADSPHEVMQGKDIRLGFPELIGLENILIEILTGQRVSFELKGIARSLDNINPLYIDLYIISDRDENTQVNKLVIVFEDVTEKMVLEQRLVQRANEVSLVADSLAAYKNYIDKVITAMAEALLVTTTSGKIKKVNQAAQSLFGHSAEELIGQPISILIRDKDALFHASQRQRLLQGELLKNLEVTCRTKTGKEISVAFSCSAVDTDIKDLQYFVYVGRDITLAKQTEAEINQLNRDLERRAIALETANKELEAFSYSVSHDLRTPLRSIDGFSQILLEDYANQLDAQGRHYLQRVRISTQRMGQLIDDMLSLSRTSNSQMCYTTVDLSAIAHKIAAELQQNQKARQIEFAIAPSVVVQGDAKLLQIALANLLGNAWKFTSKKTSARIEFGIVRSIADSTANTALIVSDRQALASRLNRPVYFVCDNGAGFNMAYVSKIFGVFQRLHTLEEFEGTGIGLAIVQRVIHRHGGQVWAEGELGVGATFYFTLGGLAPIG